MPFGSQRSSAPSLVEALVALDVPALALDPLVADAQLRVVGRVLGQRVHHRLQLVERGVGEVGEAAVDVQQRALVLDAVAERTVAPATSRSSADRPPRSRASSGVGGGELDPAGRRVGRGQPDPHRRAGRRAGRCSGPAPAGRAGRPRPARRPARSGRSTTTSNSSPDPVGQQRRLGAVDAGPVDLAGQRVRGGHQLRQRGQRRAQPARAARAPAVDRQADLGAEPVDQPPQRRRDVRVRRADPAVPRVGGRRGAGRARRTRRSRPRAAAWWPPGAAPARAACPAGSPASTSAAGRAVGPGRRPAARAVRRSSATASGSGAGQRAQQPDPGVEHDLRPRPCR